MAPPMAAAALGRPRFTIADLVDEIDIPASGITVVEGVGGPASPLADDGDTVALAHAVGADTIVLVAEPGLGVISNVRLCAAAFGPVPTIVFLNRFNAGDALHVANHAWLVERCGLDVLVDLDDLAGRLRTPQPSLGVS